MDNLTTRLNAIVIAEEASALGGSGADSISILIYALGFVASHHNFTDATPERTTANLQKMIALVIEDSWEDGAETRAKYGNKPDGWTELEH